MAEGEGGFFVFATERGNLAWAPGVSYVANQLVTNAGTTYLCDQAHTSASNWATDQNLWTPIGGGTGIKVVPVPFAFNTPNLATGAVAYTPQVGELLIDAWLDILDSWDGSGPSGFAGPAFDLGTFISVHYGLFNWAATAVGGTELVTSGIDMGISPAAIESLDISSGAYSLSQVMAITNTWKMLNSRAVPSTPQAEATLIFKYSNFGAPSPSAPARFTTTDPLKIVVSQTGENNGGDPGSTVGSAVLYLLIATT